MTDAPAPAPKNTRPCVACAELDDRTLPNGSQYCWAFWRWRSPGQVVEDCDRYRRAGGSPPKNRIEFE